MRISFASDLHLEFPLVDRARALAFRGNSDVIVLAGDIEVGMKTVDVALQLSDLFPRSHIVWVAGNHEFYHRNIDTQIERYREACRTHDRVHFLENDSIQIGSTKFVGCTLWTDFSLLGDAKQAMEMAERGITDFKLIQTRRGEWFTPQDAANLFQQSSAYLESELSKSVAQNTVVISHFPPGLETLNPRFDLSPITAYFQANVRAIIEKFQPALWIFGHNHYSHDIQIGSTRVVSNQLGYRSEAGYIPSYRADKTIELNSREDGKP